MADHHDIRGGDPVDSALDLLRSRQWAGPTTHPSLERLLMRASKTDYNRFRLVLCVGAALLGCGAVAAATRPAWRQMLWSAPPVPVLADVPIVAISTPRAEQTAEPLAAAPQPERRVAAARPAPVSSPAPAPAGPPAGMRVASPSVQQGGLGEARVANVEIVEGVPLFEAVQVEGFALGEGGWVVACDQNSAMDAFIESYLAGDTEACMALLEAMDGRGAEPAPQSLMLAQASEGVITLNVRLAGVPVEVPGMPMFSAVSVIDAEGVWTDNVFEITTENFVGEANGETSVILRVVPSVAPTSPLPR